MTLTHASSLNDQADYLNANDHTFANQTLNAIFNAPQNAVAEDDDDDLDATIPDPDEDDLYDEDDETFPDADELDKIDDDDAGVIDDDDLSDDDDKGSTTSGMGSSSFADRPTGRTTGRMTDHEPGSGQ